MHGLAVDLTGPCPVAEVSGVAKAGHGNVLPASFPNAYCSAGLTPSPLWRSRAFLEDGGPLVELLPINLIDLASTLQSSIWLRLCTNHDACV